MAPVAPIINAVFGFTNMLVKLIEDYQEDKMIVVFDAARKNFRNNIYSDYKANRGDTPEDLIPQFELIRQCVEAFGIKQLELEGYEADDIIASYTKLARIKKVDSLLRKINGITFMEKLLPQCILSVYNNVYIKNLWTLVPLRSMFQNNELR